MLKEILRDNITIIDKEVDWVEAIKKGSIPLLNRKYIKESYVEAMINNINKLGSYIVLADKVAMPHSRPEDGVNKTSMALVKLNKVSKLKDKDVDLYFILASQDSNSHIELIEALTELLSDEEKLDLIRNCKDSNEIMSLL